MATFPSIRIEGGLLGPDVLDQLLAAQLPGQRSADFGLDGKRNLTDEIASIFADTRALWEIFQHRLERLPESDIATRVTRDAWIIPFLGLLGYETRYNQRGYSVDGLTFPVSHRASDAEESPPIHIVGARQELGRVPASGRPRLAPHSLVQEYLNRTEALWGLVTNGLTLRVLRDSTFVRRQAYVEFDLQAIVEEKRFEDFAALYRLLHRTRLPRAVGDAGDCLLEKYYAYSEEQGGRVRDHLRDGVKDCIERLANGFLRHQANDELRRRLSSSTVGNDRITSDALYRQLLRLVYRLLFLLVSEDRGLLGTEQLYRDHYGVVRLRGMVHHRAAYTHHDDLWRSLCVLWRVLSDDRPQSSLAGNVLASVLGLPVLNGELFAPVALDSFTLANDDLLQSFWSLAWYEDRATRVTRRVNYAALDVEELGSVYESLLEFHPQLSEAGTAITFDLIEEGGERRSTGSHYTPPELVAPLIRHALEPVLVERLRTPKTSAAKERAILSIRVCDLACGSGHFLLAAARRLGKELATVRTEADEPAPEAVREAIRDVMTHCIYGVDKNPLAVELCRVALWLESHAAGKPLTFLDHRIRCGDSLVGVFDLSVLERGIPDEAFKPVDGDDKKAAREAKKLNASEREAPLFHAPYAEQLRGLADGMRSLDELPEDTIEQVRAKAGAYQRIEHSLEFERLNLACDVWTAAYFQPFPNAAGSPVTTEVLRIALIRGSLSDARLNGFVLHTSQARTFFHWPLAFPEVFGSGGFDVIVGNPPFMGGLKISENFGDKYRDWVEKTFSGFRGKADICAAFFRRAFEALQFRAAFGLIATNTIAQGDTRISGLAYIIAQGGAVIFARRYMKWPGRANVEVSLVACARESTLGDSSLDNKQVSFISSRLDDEVESEPFTLNGSLGRAFQGDVLRGGGFVLEDTEATGILRQHPRSRDCLFRYLNGEDFNGHPEQQPSRWVICFHDWPLDRAEQYSELIDIVRNRVKPERDRIRIERDREKWWIFWRYRGELRTAIRTLSRVLLRSRVSEIHAVGFAPQGWVYSDATVVFAFDDYYHFALLQSNVHEAWVRRNASTMRTDIRYTPTDCFETFPFPQVATGEAQSEADRVGEAYYEHRSQVMLARQLGLTKTYNLFHNSSCQEADIVRLRELHAAMDRAVLTCYGWSDLALGHDFHTNERGQTRFTISPAARREVLRQLLELNLAVAAQEGSIKEVSTGAQTPAMSIAEFDAIAYPTNDMDRAMCVATLNIVERSGSLSSKDHLDTLLLVTHPQWCKVFLNTADKRALDKIVQTSPQALFVAPGVSIRWKNCRDYLERRHALNVARNLMEQTITVGTDFSVVKQSLAGSLGSAERVMQYALKALALIRDLRTELQRASSEEQGVLSALEKGHTQELAA